MSNAMVSAPKEFRRDIVRALQRWFSKNARDLPWRRTREPYAIWVSEIMLQQTQVKTVIPYWERWMRTLPDIASLASASTEKVHKLWEGLGYYSRVRNMQRAAQEIEAKYGGEFPTDFVAVLGLPGVGRYTAGAICSIAFNQPVPILDGNIVRVLARIFRIGGRVDKDRVRKKLWSLAQELVSRAAESKEADACSRLNQSLMELGALVCTPKSPACPICPVAQFCGAFRAGEVLRFPNRPTRPRTVERQFTAFVCSRRGRFLVRQRPGGIVNGLLWEFPNVEVSHGNFGRTGEALFTVKHSIMCYRHTIEVVRGEEPGPMEANGAWLTLRRMRELPFAGGHRQILARLAGKI